MTEKLPQNSQKILTPDKLQPSSKPMEKSIIDLCGYFPKPKKSLTEEEINEIIQNKK